MSGDGARPAEAVFAIGDSWFNYFFTDLYRVLGDHGFAVERTAWPGDTLVSIAARTQVDPVQAGAPPQLSLLAELLAGSSGLPRAIVVSAGGDDVVALEAGQRRLVRLLRAADDGGDPLIDVEVGQLVDVELRAALETVLAQITAMCRDRFCGRTVPILVHGYAYPVPDGRRGPFGAGPWLGPCFAAKGYGRDRLALRSTVMQVLIDRLHAMQVRVIDDGRFRHARHVDLRRVLMRPGEEHRTLWENELHPTRRGFEIIGAAFARALRSLPPAV